MNKYLKTGLKIAGCICAVAAVAGGVAFIAERIEEFQNRNAEKIHKPYGIYEHYIKRPLDCILSTGALIVFSPILLVLTIVGAFEMKGNPFFTQERPGRIDVKTGIERKFRLVKFRSMSNLKDDQGNLLPDDVRLNRYGRLLRKTSLDELPELLNIIKGDMSVVGPRPLLVKYLPYYTAQERHRHDVRPGLTGLAQVNGRNTITWEEKFHYDLEYAKHITFLGDCKIIFETVSKVLKHSDILVGKEFKVGKLLVERKDWILTPEGAIPQEKETV